MYVAKALRPHYPLAVSLTSPPQSNFNKGVKVDDDDGHYIVVPDADLTDKCMSHRPYPPTLVFFF